MTKKYSYLFVGIGFMIAIFTFSGCQQPILDDDQKKLKKLHAYRLSDFNFAKEVKYFEIVQYDPPSFSIAPIIRHRYDISSYNNLSDSNKKALASLKFVGVDEKSSGKGLRNMFVFSSDLSPRERKKIAISIAMSPGYVNLHYVDQNLKVKVIAMKKELKAFLGEIDAPAEELLCWYLNIFN